jgi:MoaA/NifB/PqqE/SkfB family radical SAM enzyme
MKSRILNTDISGACNLTCPSCPRGRRLAGGPTGFMTFDTWKEVVEKAQKEFKVALIDFNNWGEPTLNKDLPLMAAYCQAHGLHFRISTNLQKVDGLEVALACGADLIWLSTSGWSQETYGRTHQGSFEKLRENMIWLSEKKKSVKSRTQLILRWHRYKHNCHEERDARKFARQHGIIFEPHVAWYLPIQKLIHGPADDTAKLLLIPINEGLEAVKDLPRPQTCPEYSSVHVDANRQTKLCCLTYNLNVGDYLEQDIGTLDAARHNHPFCGSCMEANALEYLAKTHPRLLRIAARNATATDVKLRLYCEMAIHAALRLGRRIPIPYYIRSKIGMVVKHHT